MTSLQFRPHKRSKCTVGSTKTGDTITPEVADGAGASQGLEICTKPIRTYQVACFQEKAERFSCWSDLGNNHSICFSQKL